MKVSQRKALSRRGAGASAADPMAEERQVAMDYQVELAALYLVKRDHIGWKMELEKRTRIHDPSARKELGIARRLLEARNDASLGFGVIRNPGEPKVSGFGSSILLLCAGNEDQEK